MHHIDEYGVARVLEVSAFPVPHAEGAPNRVMMIIRDVTAASSHRESLASFAGTVAHDLNNPLSVIDGWAEALEDELTHSDSPEAAGAAPMVQHIRVSVDQMRGLISGLLAHSMARDQALDLEMVSLRNQVKHIVATLDHPRAGGEIVAGDLLDVWADRVLLRQVLDNLIGNALKYVAPGTVPRVVVEAESDDRLGGRASRSGTTGSGSRRHSGNASSRASSGPRARTTAAPASASRSVDGSSSAMAGTSTSPTTPTGSAAPSSSRCRPPPQRSNGQWRPPAPRMRDDDAP